MRFDQPLDDALGARSLVRILRMLVLAPPEVNLTGREVGRRARVSHPQASRCLRSLAGQGLVVERRFGTYALYEFNLCGPDRELDVEAAMIDLDEEVRRRYGNRLRVLVESAKWAIECVREGEGPWPQIARDGIPVFRAFPRVR